MNLIELRAMVINNLFEEGRIGVADAVTTRYVNAAMQHVSAMAASLDAGLMAIEHQVTIANPQGDWIKWIALSYKVRQIVGARRSNAPNLDDPTLEVITFGNVMQRLGSGLSERPLITLRSQQVGAIQPMDGIQVELHYVPVLPDMTNDYDTPGQAGQVGVQNLLPVEWHPVIADYATIKVLARESLDSRAWREIYQEEILALTQAVLWERKAAQRA